jgi:histidine triad (HIT) family protein
LHVPSREGIVDALSCVFCDIINKSASAYIIYEDDEYIAFLDKYPISLGHTLVLPKKHLERVNDLTQKEFCSLYARVYGLNRIITSKLGATASHISINDGAAANQLIPHVHVHIIPRSQDDNAGFTARKLLKPEVMEEVRRKLATSELNLELGPDS